MADGVLAHGHVVAGGYMLSVYYGPTGADFAPEGPRGGWREADCFFQAGAEVAAGVEEAALADVVGRGEGAADFVVEARVRGVVAREVEEDGGEGGGCCVAACAHFG